VETYLTVEELAEHLKIAPQTIRRWIMNDDIPHRKIMGVIRFRLSEIELWIETRFDSPIQKLVQAVYEKLLFEDSISLDELSEMEQANEYDEEENND